MNKVSTFILKLFRKSYSKISHLNESQKLSRVEDAEIASSMIYELLTSEKPCMIARFGATEFSAYKIYRSEKSNKHSICDFIKGKQPEWWWSKRIINQMQEWSGFYPSSVQNLQRFGDLMERDIKELDILGSWIKDEGYVQDELLNVNLIHLRLLEPFWSQHPWTKALQGKTVLVVHPFAELIAKQYNDKREYLFKNQEILPLFNLKVIPAVQSLGGDNNDFKDWFEALKYMESQIDKQDYDICLIGCGAYGFPLAAHVKRQGKKAFHLGGALQLLFGIKGKRWENPNYGVKEWNIDYGSYSSLMNNYWVRPSQKMTPKNSEKVENACYW